MFLCKFETTKNEYTVTSIKLTWL